jgi:hypothetical protein
MQGICEAKIYLSMIWSSQASGYEDFHLLVYNIVESVNSQPTFRKNMPPPSYSARYLLHAGFLLDLSVDTEDGGDMFLWNVGWFLTDCTKLYPRILQGTLLFDERQMLMFFFLFA